MTLFQYHNTPKLQDNAPYGIIYCTSKCTISPCFFSARTEYVDYIIADEKRFLDPMRKITNYILRKAGVKPKGEVVDLDSRRVMG